MDTTAQLHGITLTLALPIAFRFIISGNLLLRLFMDGYQPRNAYYPMKIGEKRSNRPHIFRLIRENRTRKTGAFQPEPPGNFPVEREKPELFKTELFNQSRPGNSWLNREIFG